MHSRIWCVSVSNVRVYMRWDIPLLASGFKGRLDLLVLVWSYEAEIVFTSG